MATLIVTGMISQRSDIWKEMDVATGNQTTGAGLDDLWDMLGFSVPRVGDESSLHHLNTWLQRVLLMNRWHPDDRWLGVFHGTDIGNRCAQRPWWQAATAVLNVWIGIRLDEGFGLGLVTLSAEVFEAGTKSNNRNGFWRSFGRAEDTRLYRYLRTEDTLLGFCQRLK
jgi:hypothetical protein